MTKNLVIVESPTKSKTIGRFLGKNYTVKASMGHLRDLPKSQFGVDIENHFTPKYINIRGKGELIKELKSLAKKADKIYLATDPDREGEAIAWHLSFLLGVNPEDSCRIAFHEITPKAVKEALKNPGPIDMDKVDAQQTRRILDRIVGYKLSPLLWRKIRKGLSAGRVQSVAVKIICDRQKEIDAFEPEEYWTSSVTLAKDSKSQKFTADVIKKNGKKLEIHNREEADAVTADLKAASYAVKDSSVKDRIRRPAAPFTTSSLQQEAVKHLNFTTRKTMMVAQQLYEGVALGRKTPVGLITYMRTDSVHLAAEALTEIRGYIENEYGSKYVPQKPNFYSSKKNAQEAHEAIRPTSVLRTPESVAPYLDRDQLRLYTLIWKRTVACQMSSSVSAVTTLAITGGDYELKATGSVVTFDGFLKIMDKKDLEKNKKVPDLPKGTPLKLISVDEAIQHFTEPPPYFTEATLVKELEDKGIGRPSTYAAIIQTILSRDYVTKESKKIVPTELGKTMIEMLTQYFKGLIDVPFSAHMESELDAISEHKMSKEDVLNEFYQPFEKELEVAEKEIPVVEKKEIVTDIKCEKCGRFMVIKEGRHGKFLACPGFPKCRNTKPIYVKIGVQCPECGGDLIERHSKTGRLFYGCSNYPKCRFTSWDKPINEKCPVCGSIMLEAKDRSGKVTHYCSNEECVNGRPKKKTGRVTKRGKK
ncbi:MAG: type I DNA topoisomerase [Acidaminococcus sp.]|jgi:DNA topoisomerase-1|nr:type I DNA topoisomerase [Acidaminococcus sp.]MCI2099472.1 type I DNA topoisomerase [Acidaminococcus sp.]MCI2113832.1 type I DNA topoisomerase [Acidaminococcus sp.]MCI2115594.1 type I DNA topoisomerase [Acidaminococcus sp.]